MVIMAAVFLDYIREIAIFNAVRYLFHLYFYLS